MRHGTQPIPYPTPLYPNEMDSIAFVDSEIDPRNNKILDLGAVKTDGSVLHSGSVPAFVEFLKGVRFICGHNILAHDLKYLAAAVEKAGISPDRFIDTLPLSPLLFPKRPYHALLKDDMRNTNVRRSLVHHGATSF